MDYNELLSEVNDLYETIKGAFEDMEWLMETEDVSEEGINIAETGYDNATDAMDKLKDIRDRITFDVNAPPDIVEKIEGTIDDAKNEYDDVEEMYMAYKDLVSNIGDEDEGYW